MRNPVIALKKIEKLAAKIACTKIHYITLCRILNAEFKSMKVRFKFHQHSNLGEYLSVGGGYNDPNSRDDGFIYTVDIARDPTANPYIRPRRGFFTEVYLVLAHEFRHGYQYNKRNFRNAAAKDMSYHHSVRKVQDEIRYLSDYDELDAYAYEAAIAIKLGCQGQTSAKYDRFRTIDYKIWKRFQKKVYLFSHK